MSFNTVIEALPTGYNDFDVVLEPYEPPPPTDTGKARKAGAVYLWTIHPKRRSNAVADQRLKRNPFRRLSVNTDFRAWRRIVEYGKTVIKRLFHCEMTYGEMQDTGMTYGELEATGLTYGEMSECEPIIT